MKKQLFQAVVITALAATACKKSTSLPDTVAGFSKTGDNRAAPTKVSFTNSSTNAFSSTWDFGDGKTSTEDNPEHIFKNPGTYTVTLTAKGNTTITITKTVTVLPAYTQVKTTYVKLVAIPFIKAGGSGWDTDATGPDVFFKITDGTNIFADASASKFSDVTQAMLPLQWNFTTPLAQAVAKATKIQVFDYDLITTNELIGEVPFSGLLFNNYETWPEAYPAKVTIPYNGTTLELGLEWQ